MKINSAQAGKAIKLNIGKDATFDSESVTSVRIADSSGADINPLTDDRLKPIEAAKETAIAVTADTNILSTNYTPENTPCTVRVMACFDVSGVLSAMITTGGTARQCKLNGVTV